MRKCLELGLMRSCICDSDWNVLQFGGRNKLMTPLHMWQMLPKELYPLKTIA